MRKSEVGRGEKCMLYTVYTCSKIQREKKTFLMYSMLNGFSIATSTTTVFVVSYLCVICVSASEIGFVFIVFNFRATKFFCVVFVLLFLYLQ